MVRTKHSAELFIQQTPCTRWLSTRFSQVCFFPWRIVLLFSPALITESPLRFTSTGQSSTFIQPLASLLSKWLRLAKRSVNQWLGKTEKSKYSVPSPLTQGIPTPLNFSGSSVTCQVLGQFPYGTSSPNLYNTPGKWVLPPLSSQETEAQGS